MAPDVPQPADEEFESRLAWTPPAQGGTATVRPGSPAPVRRGRAAANGGATANGATRSGATSGGATDGTDELRRAIEELRDELAEVGSELAALRTAVADHVGPSRADLATLLEEVVQLRRRIALRASGATSDLDDAAVDRIAAAVVARLASAPTATARTRRR